jgi:hypothetical protein
MGAEATGTVGLDLQIAGGLTLNSVSYTISGPNPYTGTIDLTSASALSFQVGNIASGSGYTLSLTGTATDGVTTCTGTSAAFSVAAHATTTVGVTLDCKTPATKGSVLVNGTINVCPTVASVSSNPPVGNTIALTAAATDPDGGPSPVSYTWTTSSGTLSSTTSATPTLTCSAAGPVNLTVTATDGDSACADTFNLTVQCPDDSALDDPAWVVMTPGGGASARVVTPYAACPPIMVNGVSHPMNVRAAAANEPLRPTQNDPTPNPASTTSKPSLFPVTACEYTVPAGTTSLSVVGKTLPVPKTTVNRVVILGDTGCRLAIGNAIQNCNDPTQWPFPVIAQAAAATNPDLVLHVGDMHYREIACPDDTLGCHGPWGYGYDVWAADFFTPAKSLLAAAPWVMVRGNHESCTRGGQGWYRFLDTLPYSESRSCNDPANDNTAAYNDPYAVRFGDTQFVVFDSSNVGKNPYAPATKPADVLPFNTYTTELAQVGTLANDPTVLSIFTNHHPLLAYTAGSPPTGGNPALLSVMSAAYPTAYYPPGVGMALHGHVHDFQAINFSSGHPATIVAGIGGDNLDAALPNPFPSNVLPAAGTVIDQFAYTNTFGFLVMDRLGAQEWKFTAFRRDGTIMTTCTMTATTIGSGTPPSRQMSCTNVGNLP